MESSPGYDPDAGQRPQEAYWLDDASAPVRASAQPGEGYDVDLVHNAGVEGREDELAFVGHWVRREELGSAPSPREVAEASEAEDEIAPESFVFAGRAQLSVPALGSWAEEVSSDDVEVRPYSPKQSEKPWWLAPRTLTLILLVLFLLTAASVVRVVLLAVEAGS